MAPMKLTFYSTFNDGKHAAVVRHKGLTKYWITSFQYAKTLDTDSYSIIATTMGR